MAGRVHPSGLAGGAEAIEPDEILSGKAWLADAVGSVRGGLQGNVDPFVEDDAGDGGIHGGGTAGVAHTEGDGIEDAGDAGAIDEDEGLDPAFVLIDPAERGVGRKRTPGLARLVAAAKQVYNDEAAGVLLDVVLAGHDYGSGGGQVVIGTGLGELLVQFCEEWRPEVGPNAGYGVKDESGASDGPVGSGLALRRGRQQRTGKDENKRKGGGEATGLHG